MSIVLEFSIVPVGAGAGISPQVAKVMKIVAESGIPYRVNPMGTVLEGEWDAVMGLVRKCHEAVMKDEERAVTAITIDDCRGRETRMEKKIASVEQKLGMKLKQ